MDLGPTPLNKMMTGALLLVQSSRFRVLSRVSDAKGKKKGKRAKGASLHAPSTLKAAGLNAAI